MSHILEGTKVKEEIKEVLKKEIGSFVVKPCLAIVQIGNMEESNAYIFQKKLFGNAIGVEVRHTVFPETISQEEVIAEIEKMNGDVSINGIILQLPVPTTLHVGEIIERINPKKDVDGLTSANVKLLAENDSSGFVPATTKGILELMDYYGVNVEGKKVVVMGRSALVGKPTAQALLNRKALVSVVHSQTPNPQLETQSADILVVAIGKPRYVTESYVKAGQVIVDVGINLDTQGLKEEIAMEGSTTPSRKLVGDVDFDAVKDIVDWISPVPGGVGAMTVASLFQNVVEAYKKQRS